MEDSIQNSQITQLYEVLKEFTPGNKSLGKHDFAIRENDLPQIVKDILMRLKKEKGLTYIEAYAVLEVVFRRLEVESKFVSLQ